MRRRDRLSIRMTRLLFLITVLLATIAESMKLGLIGQPCRLNDKKPCVLPNSQCIEGICMCSSFYKFINGSCITDKSKTLGKKCHGGGDCPGEGEFCSSFSICMCLSTHVDVGTQCKPVIYPGQFGCEDSLQCSKGFPGAECDVSRVCVCPHGMIVSQQTCIPNNQKNSTRSAIIHDLMQHNVIMSDHRISRTDFRGNFFRRRTSEHATSSTYQLEPDSVCMYDNQCSGYPLAICDSVCKCVKGSLNTGSTCIASTSALQSTVACPAGQIYVREAGVCMTVQHPGEPCQYSQQCSAVEPGAYCLKMRCECVYGMKKSSNGCTFVNNNCKQRGHIFISELGECREVIPPGGQGCSHNLQCSGAYPDATCFMQTCTCPPNLPAAVDGTCGRACPDGQVYSGVTGECLPIVQPGEACLYSPQCQKVFGGMVCDKNVCRCPNGLVFDGSRCANNCPPTQPLNQNDICVTQCSSGLVESEGECLRKVEIGQPCATNLQCQFGSFCQGGSCLCPPGFYVTDGQCRAVESEPNGSCANNEKCTKGSVCYNGRCTCPRNHELVNGHCQPNRAVPIGSACVRVGVTCDGGSTCVAGVCVCPLGTTPRNGVCVRITTAKPGESCADGQECTDGTTCDEETRRCQCVNPTQMVIGERCVDRLRSHPGYGCTMGELCVGNSVCINGKCECPTGKVEINKICVEPMTAKIGDTCGRSYICSGGSYCNSESMTCACRKGQKEVRGECKHVQIVYPGERCGDVTNRCAGGSYCVHGRCECPFNMNVVDRKCVVQQKAAPGEPCQENTICTGGSVCRSKVCSCLNDMVIREKTCSHRRKVHIGDSCEPVVDQCMGNSTCTEGKCECPPGQVNSNHVCAPPKNVSPGYLCNPEDICIGQSVCVRGVCQCEPGYKLTKSSCVKVKNGIEGTSCSHTDDCMNNLACIEGACGCSEEMYAKNGRCHHFVVLGQACTNDDRCLNKDAQCVEGKCDCVNGLINVNEECVAPIVTPVEPESSSQVAVSQVSSSQSRSGLIGHYCQLDHHCKVVHSVCQRSVCICREGYRIFGSTQCIPRRRTEARPIVETQRCMASNQCPAGANCINGECKCKPGLGLSRLGFCIPINYADPGRSCAHGEKCRGDSFCIDGMCACNSPLVLHENKCVKSSRDIVREANIALNMLKECPTDGSCRLPDCFCTKSGKQPPLNVDIKKIPQMVMLTFDDPVTDRIINTLKALFSGKIRNPNGCPIRGTFFISHQWNNYDQSQWLYSKGNELAVNSITREILANRTKERWSQEQNGMKNTLAEYSYADKKNIIGARAPGHLIGGDNQMEILKDNGFLYDNSIIVNGQYWPQTLDYKMAWDGTNTPTKSHKGLWEIPVQMVQGNDGMWYNTLSMAIKPSDSRVSVKQMLMRNFMQNYKSNRAPFVLTLSTEFLTYLPDNGAILALNDFLSEIVQRTDVYIVTGSQLIDWMKKPMDIDSLKHLPSWQCNFKMNDHVQPCESPSICSYSGRQPGQVAHSFRICGSCPKKYTWI